MKEFVSVDFKPLNEFYLITLGSGMLCYWKWDSQKIKAQDKVDGTHCSFSPEGLHIAVTGNNAFRYYEMINEETETLKPLYSKISGVSENISTNYTSHSFSPNSQLAISTESGHILLLGTDGILIKVIDSQKNIPLYSISTSKKGIVAGGKGIIAVYASTGRESEPYKFLNHSILKDNEEAIATCVDMSLFSNAHAAILTSNNQLLKATMTFTETLPSIEYLICEFHSGAINGMDLCVRKPLVVTCSKEDKTVKVWNYSQRRLELSKRFVEEILNVAFHPSGFHVIIGLQDKFLMMNVISNDLIVFHPQQLKVIELSLSNGGHLLAVADQANQSRILVYNFYTGFIVPALEDKIKHNNKIKSIKWFDDDSGFISSDIGGVVNEWKFQDIGNYTQYIQKGAIFTSMLRVNDPTTNTYNLFIACGDKYIREVNNGTETKKHDIGIPVSQLTIMKSRKLMFAGRSETQKPGTLKLLKFPLCNESVELQVHSQEIERVAVNCTDQYLLTCSRDGSLYVFDIKDRDKLAKDMDEMSILYSEEMLSNKDEQDNLIRKKEHFLQTIQDAKSENTKEQFLSTKQEEISNAQAELVQITKSNEDKKRQLEEKIRLEEQLADSKLQDKGEEYLNEMDDIKNKYSQELINKNTEYSEETVKKEEKEKQMVKEITEKTEEHNNELTKLTEEYMAEEIKKAQEIEKKKTEMEYTKKQDEERKKELHSDLIEEEKKVMEKNQGNIKKVNDAVGKTKGDLQNSRKKIQENTQKKQELERDLQDKEQEMQKKRDEQSKLKLKQESLESDKKEKDGAIGKLEDQIYTLKKETQELEKFKYVLDYKIKELKRDISPREKEIQKLKAQTNDMDQDLKDFNKYNSHLGLIVKELEKRLTKKKELMAQQRNSIRDSEVLIKRMKDAVYAAVQHIEDYEKLKLHLELLKSNFVKKEINTLKLETEIKKEYDEQKEYLVQSVNILKDQLVKDAESHKKDNNKIRLENKSLIDEIAKLRKKLELKGESGQPQKKSIQDIDEALLRNKERLNKLIEAIKKLEAEEEVLKAIPTQ